jgi:suppressor of G2 allele of SKP1
LKIEIKMRKMEGFRWAALEGEGKPHDVKPAAAKADTGDETGAKSNVSSYPTSSTKGPKNWDKMAKDVN